MTSSSERAPVVVAARAATMNLVTDVLLNWSTLGLVGPVHLVDLDAGDVHDPLVPSVLVQDGVRHAAALQSQLAEASRAASRLRLVVISDEGAAGRVDPDAALRLLESVRRSIPAGQIVPVHLRVRASDDPAGLEDAWHGWHNLLLAAENLRAPGHGVTLILRDPSHPRLRTHLCAALVTIAGLWEVQTSSLVDDREVSPARTWVALRTFSRHLSADPVEQALLERLSDVSDSFPRPHVEGVSARKVEDETGAATAMADQLVAKHEALLLKRDRPVPRRSAGEQIGAVRALKMLFAFLWSALRSAPAAFADRIVHAVSSGVAGTVSGLVFGASDSEYEVVVNGIRRDGSLASWGEVDEAVEAVAARLGGAPVHAGGAALSAVWRDYVAAGLTLLDGANRSTGLPPVTMGTHRAVVSRPDHVAHHPDSSFEVSDEIAAYLSVASMAPNDPMGARLFEQEIRELAEKQPQLRGRVEVLVERLRSWRDEREKSFSGRVGMRVAKAVHDTRAEISALVSELRAAQSAQSMPDSIAEQQASLSKTPALGFSRHGPADSCGRPAHCSGPSVAGHRHRLLPRRRPWLGSDLALPLHSRATRSLRINTSQARAGRQNRDLARPSARSRRRPSQTHARLPGVPFMVCSARYLRAVTPGKPCQTRRIRCGGGEGVPPQPPVRSSGPRRGCRERGRRAAGKDHLSDGLALAILGAVRGRGAGRHGSRRLPDQGVA